MQAMAHLTSRLIRHINRGLDELFPVHCVSCGEWIDTTERNGVYCPACREEIMDQTMVSCPQCKGLLPDRSLVNDDSCYCCDQAGKALTGIITLGAYHENPDLGKMILAMKHGGKTIYAREFGTQLARQIACSLPGEDFDGVVAVPLHYTRKWRRGYNQAGLVAGFLGKELGIPCYDWLLSRQRKTRPQSGGRTRRRENIRDAFKAGGRCENARMILVDDVVTTGATIRESAEILYSAGAEAVLAAAVTWVPMGYPLAARDK